jgi:predicted  nucleic acid-binding Zn-ribbon protein
MRIERKVIILLLTLLLVTPIAGCQEKDSAQEAGKNEPQITNEQGLQDMLDNSLSGIKQEIKKLQPHADQLSDQAQDEVKKLSTFEYLVKTYSNQTSDSDLQAEFTKLGQERWECFEILPVANELRVFCSRRPETYLRYIPKLF